MDSSFFFLVHFLVFFCAPEAEKAVELLENYVLGDWNIFLP